ncbi:hypothetical protein BMS3Abin16_00636 [archaeon BMS3Abin16]|nr:hypothetical protein BMS3Abin16_00636 [archaeon BMS3Abin16]HDY74193.1 hypothetical protein [Euryarchaeota archaeon]
MNTCPFTGVKIDGCTECVRFEDKDLGYGARCMVESHWHDLLSDKFSQIDVSYLEEKFKGYIDDKLEE